MITNISQSLPHIMAENSWHMYGMKKLRLCHPTAGHQCQDNACTPTKKTAEHKYMLHY